MPLNELQFYVDIVGDRAAAQDLRDKIITALKPLGIRADITDDGLVVFMSAPSESTFADQLAARPLGLAAANEPQATCSDPAAPYVPRRPGGVGNTR